MFYPSVENQAWHTWWRFSPAFFIAVLKVMGFDRCTATTSIQFYKNTPMTLHTVVAERTGKVDRSAFKSDAGQDQWIIEHVFQKALSGGYRGFFVDAGASDGISASNTYVLERVHGWTGILVEPNRLFFEKLINNRPGLMCFRAALAAQDGEMSFIEAGYYGAVVDHVRPIFERAGVALDANPNYRDNADGTPAQRVTVPARSLRSLLKEVGAPKIIDYLSLDVEASEFEVLKGFPFETHKIGALTLEGTYPLDGVLVDHEHREPCRLLLESHGYRRVGTIGVDDAYLPV
jgi:FkbM family methyltransferase